MHFFKSEDVTSEKNVAKYTKLWEKSGGDPTKGWKHPGRTVEWLTTWHPELQFYVFDHIDPDYFDKTKLQRYESLKRMFKTRDIGAVDAHLIAQFSLGHIDQVFQAYDQAIINGGEGLVMMKKTSLYKMGRLTLNQAEGFKIKDSNKEFDGQIISVEESTVAREGAEKSINELGRSRTSQLKEDRIPSGMAKGFKVLMDDGNTTTVSLQGYNHADRIDLLENAPNYAGKWIKFTGMAPVKPGGCPRHAHYTKGNIRDEK
jgi:hypothetical protein